MRDAMSLAGHQANSARQLCACLDRNGRSGPERLCLLWIKPRLMKHSESFAGGRSTGLMRNCWTTCDHFSRIPEDYQLRVVQNAPDTASPSTYRKRFGSLRHAYELIGYGRAADFGAIDLRRRTQAMRENLIARIKNMFADQMSTVRKGGRWRNRLRLRNGPNVSVLISRPLRVWKTTIRWIVDPVRNERKFVTLLARLNVSKDAFQDFHILPNIERRKRFSIELHDAWLNRGGVPKRVVAILRSHRSDELGAKV